MGENNHLAEPVISSLGCFGANEFSFEDYETVARMRVFGVLLQTIQFYNHFKQKLIT